MVRRDGPHEIVQKVEDNAYKIELWDGWGDNAYKIKLWDDMNIYATFNVGDLTPYIEDEDEGIEDLRANPLQGGG